MVNHNEKGMTLIEVLAIITIITVISLLLLSILNSSSKQQKDQTKEVEQIQNGAFILKQITKDLRKSYRLSVDSQSYSFLDQNGKELYKYEYNGNEELYRNDSLIGSDIKNFSIIGDQTVTLKFTINEKQYTTTITFRRGSPN